MSQATGIVARVAARFGVSPNVALLTGSATLAQSLSVLSAPLVTRLFAPSDLGLFGAFWAVATVAAIGVGLRYEFAIPLPESDEDARGVLWLSLLTALPLSIIVAIGYWAWLRSSSEALPGVPVWSALVLQPTLVVLGLTAAIRFWGVRSGAFEALSRIGLRQSAARVVLTLGAGVVGAGWVGLVAGEVFARLVGVWELGRDAIRGAADRVRVPPVRTLRALAVRYRRSPSVILPSHLCDALASAAFVPLVLGSFGATSAGLLLLVQRLTSVPAALLGASIADVFHSESAAASRADASVIRVQFRATVGRLAVFATILLVPLGLLAPFVFGRIFGQEWREAGALTAALTPWTWAAFVVSPVSRVLTVVRREPWKFAYDVVALAGLFGAFVVSERFGFGLIATVWVVSLVQAAAYGLFLSILWVAVRVAGSPPPLRAPR